MSLWSYCVLYVIALGTFLAIDLTWLGFVARGIYASLMRDILAPQVNWPAALGFYALFVVGLIYFAIGPAVREGSLSTAMLNGAFYGLFTYATYDLTNYAVLKGYPAAIVPIDIAWGVVLACAVSSLTFLAYRALPL
jgi:uncharacterized membrane protein